MTRLNPIFTSLKTLNITYQTPQETLLATPETLPTSEPATPQIGYTVAGDHLPAFNMSVYQKIWIALVYGAGKFVTAGTVYWRMKKNGVSVSTGSASVSANVYYSVSAFFYNVAVGDVLELALWSNQTDSNWDYKAYQIQVTRLILMDKPRLLVPCNFANIVAQPVLTLGTPSAVTSTLIIYHLDKVLASISTPTVFESLQPKGTYGMFRAGRGDYTDADSAVVSSSATYRPLYYRNYVPTQIIMRGVKTD
jgi:hypothetical protein